MTAWRIEGTLREFASFAPVNLWFDYPVHKLDSGLLEDLQPDSDFRTLGAKGASRRWGDKAKQSKDRKAELDTAFEACMMDGEVTVYSLGEYMDLKAPHRQEPSERRRALLDRRREGWPQGTRQQRLNALLYSQLHFVVKMQ